MTTNIHILYDFSVIIISFSRASLCIMYTIPKERKQQHQIIITLVVIFITNITADNDNKSHAYSLYVFIIHYLVTMNIQTMLLYNLVLRHLPLSEISGIYLMEIKDQRRC